MIGHNLINDLLIIEFIIDLTIDSMITDTTYNTKVNE